MFVCFYILVPFLSTKQDSFQSLYNLVSLGPGIGQEEGRNEGDGVREMHTSNPRIR